MNIIEKTHDGFALFLGTHEEKYKKYTESIGNFWHIDNLNKPLRGISSYKVKFLNSKRSKRFATDFSTSILSLIAKISVYKEIIIKVVSFLMKIYCCWNFK